MFKQVPCMTTSPCVNTEVPFIWSQLPNLLFPPLPSYPVQATFSFISLKKSTNNSYENDKIVFHTMQQSEIGRTETFSLPSQTRGLVLGERNCGYSFEICIAGR